MNWTPVNLNFDPQRCSQCGTCGAIVPYRNHAQHTNFHATFSHRKGDNMSNVTWCDPGEHAFKKDAPGSVHFEGKRAGESGAIESVTTDACAIHNPFPVVKPNATSQLTIDSTFELNGGVVD